MAKVPKSGKCGQNVINVGKKCKSGKIRCRLDGSYSSSAVSYGSLSLRFESLSLIRWDAVAIVLLNRIRCRLD